jgi:hypothetical protein
VLVVVEGQDDHVARLVKLQEVARKLPVDEVVPRLGLVLRALHQPDLPVYEHGGGLERGLARERVRQVLFERAQPGGVNRHAFFLAFGKARFIHAPRLALERVIFFGGGEGVRASKHQLLLGSDDDKESLAVAVEARRCRCHKALSCLA